MRAIHLSIRLTVYYLAVAGLVFALSAIIPGFQTYLPVGGSEALLTGVSRDPFNSIEIDAAGLKSLQDSIIWLAFAVAGSLLTVLPLAWTYMAVRSRDEYDQSIVETIMVLPVAVTSIVVIVSQSIALAFGLAGIVGGVRFRNTLQSSGDALYILTAIGIGLAAGVGALEIGIIMTVVFNYCFLWLWAVDFGGRNGVSRYMRLAGKKSRKNGGNGKSAGGQ